MEPKIASVDIPNEIGINKDAEIPSEALESPDKYVTWKINKFIGEGNKEFDHNVFESFKSVLNKDLKKYFNYKKDLHIMFIPDMENPGGVRVFVKDRIDEGILTMSFVGDKDILKQLSIILENTSLSVVKELPHKMAFFIK